METKLSTILGGSTRLRLTGGSLLAVLFLTAYNRQICPFINGLHLLELIANLTGVLVVQLAVREVLFLRAKPQSSQSLARQGYRLSVVSWLVAGVVASLVHYLRYPGFPASSHLKLLSSYWVLGAGILAQWEYITLEQAQRKLLETLEGQKSFLEHVSRRIVEGYFLFTLGPVIFMLLVVLRFQYEGYLDKGVALEVFYIGAFCVVTAILVALQYGKSLKEDTRTMIEGLRKVERGDFEVHLPVQRSDEFGEMSEGINHMARGLFEREKIREVFGRFVDPQLAKGFMERYIRQDQSITMGGDKAEVVILMSDIRGFTPLAETMAPEALVPLLNGYFSEMVAAIHEQGGIVDKFIGDAIMAVFGLVESGGNPAEAAVKAALGMQTRLASLNNQSPETPLRNGVGIHSGEVIAGFLGSEERLEFTVIGSPVNIAARIESHAREDNPPILFSPEIKAQLSDSFQVYSVCTTKLKGVSLPVELYSVKAGPENI